VWKTATTEEYVCVDDVCVGTGGEERRAVGVCVRPRSSAITASALQACASVCQAGPARCVTKRWHVLDTPSAVVMAHAWRASASAHTATLAMTATQYSCVLVMWEILPALDTARATPPHASATRASEAWTAQNSTHVIQTAVTAAHAVAHQTMCACVTQAMQANTAT